MAMSARNRADLEDAGVYQHTLSSTRQSSRFFGILQTPCLIIAYPPFLLMILLEEVRTLHSLHHRMTIDEKVGV